MLRATRSSSGCASQMSLRDSRPLRNSLTMAFRAKRYSTSPGLEAAGLLRTRSDPDVTPKGYPRGRSLSPLTGLVSAKPASFIPAASGLH